MLTINGFLGKCSKIKIIPFPILPVLMMMVVVSVNISMVETAMCRRGEYCCHFRGPYWEKGQFTCDKCCDLDQRCAATETCCGGYDTRTGSCLRCCKATGILPFSLLSYRCDACCSYYGSDLKCNKCCPQGHQCGSQEYCCGNYYTDSWDYDGGYYDSDSGNCLGCCEGYLEAVCNFAQKCCAGDEYISDHPGVIDIKMPCTECCTETAIAIGLTVVILVVIIIIIFFVFVAAKKIKVQSKIPPPPVHPLVMLSQAEAQDQDDEGHSNDVTENLIPPNLYRPRPSTVSTRPLPSPPPPSYDEVFPWNPEPSAPPYLTLMDAVTTNSKFNQEPNPMKSVT